jgi:hypothetical protein
LPHLHNLTHAAEGASGRLEQAMDRVLGQLEGQITELKDSFGGFRDAASTYVAETSARVAASQEQGVQNISAASAKAASALEEGLGHAMAEIRKEVEALSSAVSGGADPILDGVVRMDRGFLWIGLRVMTAQSLASGGHCGRMEV